MSLLGYNTHPFYGKGKSWTKHHIERLLHKLVIEEYLGESMYINNEITCAYVGLGSKAKDLMTSNSIKVLQNTIKYINKSNIFMSIIEILDRITNKKNCRKTSSFSNCY